MKGERIISRRDFLKEAGITLGALTFASSFGNKAQAKKSLNVITWGGSYLEGFKRAGDLFEDKYGISINFVTHSGGSYGSLSKIAAKWPNSPYDVFAGWEPTWRKIAKEGWYVPLTEKDVPNLKEQKAGGIIEDPETELNIAASIDSTTVEWAFMTDQIDQLNPLLDLEQLIMEDRFKNNVLLSSVTEGLGLQLVSFAKQRGGDEHNIDPGFEFAKELAKAGSIGGVYDSETQFSSPMFRGEYAVSFGYSNHWNRISRNRNVSPLKYLGDDMVYFFHDGVAVIDTDMKKWSKKFVNLLISEEANEYYAKKTGNAPMNKNAEKAKGIERFQLTREKAVDKFGYAAQYRDIFQVQDKWNQRWQEEIVPFL